MVCNQMKKLVSIIASLTIGALTIFAIPKICAPANDITALSEVIVFDENEVQPAFLDPQPDAVNH